MSAESQQLIMDFSSASSHDLNDPFSLGFEFQVTSPIIVTGLADFKPSSGGNEVGLWAVGNTIPLATAVVADTDPLLGNGNFNYVSIAPLILSPGYYIVESETGPVGAYAWDAQNLITIPQVTYLFRVQASSSTLVYPTLLGNDGLQPDYFGGNVVVGSLALVPTQFSSNGGFQFSVQGIPGQTCVIQSSTNLVNWTPIYTNTGSFTFTDTNAVNVSALFYRAAITSQ